MEFDPKILNLVAEYHHVFGEIIVYLRKMIVNLKNIHCAKNSYSGNYSRKSLILPILGKIAACLCKGKEKKAHFKTVSREKSRILPIFKEMVSAFR